MLAFLAAAFLTPPDPISQIALALRTILLYELSIYAVRLAEKNMLPPPRRCIGSSWKPAAKLA